MVIWSTDQYVNSTNDNNDNNNNNNNTGDNEKW